LERKFTRSSKRGLNGSRKNVPRRMTKLRNVRYIALIKLIDGIDELAA